MTEDLQHKKRNEFVTTELLNNFHSLSSIMMDDGVFVSPKEIFPELRSINLTLDLVQQYGASSNVSRLEVETYIELIKCVFTLYNADDKSIYDFSVESVEHDLFIEVSKRFCMTDIGLLAAYFAKELNNELIYQCVNTLLLKPFSIQMPFDDKGPEIAINKQPVIAFPFNAMVKIFENKVPALKKIRPKWFASVPALSATLNDGKIHLNPNDILNSLFINMVSMGVLSYLSDKERGDGHYSILNPVDIQLIEKSYWMIDELVSETCQWMIDSIKMQKVDNALGFKYFDKMKTDIEKVLNTEPSDLSWFNRLFRFSAYIPWHEITIRSTLELASGVTITQKMFMDEAGVQSHVFDPSSLDENAKDAYQESVWGFLGEANRIYTCSAMHNRC